MFFLFKFSSLLGFNDHLLAKLPIQMSLKNKIIVLKGVIRGNLNKHFGEINSMWRKLAILGQATFQSRKLFRFETLRRYAYEKGDLKNLDSMVKGQLAAGCTLNSVPMVYFIVFSRVSWGLQPINIHYIGLFP